MDDGITLNHVTIPVSVYCLRYSPARWRNATHTCTHFCLQILRQFPPPNTGGRICPKWHFLPLFPKLSLTTLPIGTFQKLGKFCHFGQFLPPSLFSLILTFYITTTTPYTGIIIIIII